MSYKMTNICDNIRSRLVGEKYSRSRSYYWELHLAALRFPGKLEFNLRAVLYGDRGNRAVMKEALLDD